MIYIFMIILGVFPIINLTPEDAGGSAFMLWLMWAFLVLK